ncbi:MAG TPA: EI24 domain-containing protein [Polyangiales bacterium]|nr:EI24 domain-containing protein [Polyangiales bacterium]
MNAQPSDRPATQLFDGAFAIARGLRFIWRTPATWPLAALPVCICTLLCGLSIAGAIQLVPRLMAAAWPGLESSLGSVGTWIVEFLGILIAAALGVVLALFATPPLCAPALERLVLLRERELGISPRPAAGLWREFRSALAAQLWAAAIGGPLLLLLWLVDLVFPPLAPLSFALKFLVVALTWAWSLLDYPLSLRGISVADRARLMRGGAARVFGFGLGLGVVFAVPLLPLLLLPAAVAAAAEVGIKLEQNPRV